MTKATTVRVDDLTDEDIKRIAAELGGLSWSAALKVLVRKGIAAYEAEKRRAAK